MRALIALTLQCSIYSATQQNNMENQMNDQRFLSAPVVDSVFVAIRLRFEQFRNIARLKMARREAFRRTWAELQALSNRELADIGIPRSHIRRIALEESRKVQTHG